MALDIVPFDPPKHLEPASRLLAERHARDRQRDPRFPAVYEVPAACQPMVQQAIESDGAFGVVARDAGEVRGFMVGAPFLPVPTHMTAAFFPPRSISVGYGAHAAVGGDEHELYRRMYAALAEEFVARGYFDHSAFVAPLDAVVNEAFFSLGFGRALTAAMRGVEPLDGVPATKVQLHMAAGEDAKVIFGLNDELTAHHARSPIFWPRLRETDASSHEHQMELLQDPKTNAHWVAYDGATPSGMNTFMPPHWISPMLAPEKTVYLYQGVVSEAARGGGVGRAILQQGLAWAREQGYEHVALHFAAANVSGARFWLATGFRPIEHRLARHIDERIAWAR